MRGNTQKRLVLCLVALVLLSMGMSVAAIAASKTKASFSSSDLTVTVKGKKYGLMEDAKTIIKALGKYELSESISCAYDGMDKMYTFKGAVVCTLPINGKDMTDEIQITGKTYETSKGIKVGSSKADIVAAYGDDYTETDGVITYWAGKKNALKTPRLYFEMKKGTVKMFGIYGAKNAG